jgi:hypothetical protein
MQVFEFEGFYRHFLVLVVIEPTNWIPHVEKPDHEKGKKQIGGIKNREDR